MAYAADTPQVPEADQMAYWKAFALFNSAQSSFQASLTAQQKQLLDQMNQLAVAAQVAQKKVEGDCGGKLDEKEKQKNNLVCEAAPKAEEKKGDKK